MFYRPEDGHGLRHVAVLDDGRILAVVLAPLETIA